MTDLKQQKNKKTNSVKADLNIIVMPEEFKIKPPKKNNKKLFIIGGIVFVMIMVLVIVVAILLNSSTKTPVVPVETPTTPEKPVETPTTPTPTSTEPVETPSTGTLFPVESTSTSVSNLPTPPEIPIGSLITGTDSDGDGLTDKEEAIFQTSFRTPDTDGDSFYDGNEVFNLYNPAAHAPTTMLESGIVKLYKNTQNNYEVFYPAVWTSGEDKNSGDTLFLSEDTEKITIAVRETISSISLRSWYKTEFPDSDINKLQTYTSKNGYSGLQDEARLNTYIKEGDKVFIISYDLADKQTVWYRAVYGMILNSLKIN